ncbi:hypothetical protein GS508_22660 [Rhodococcus hoagii]|nr:hypothetical protein [Prescottella equi]
MVAGSTPSTEDGSFWLEGDDPCGTPFVAIADMSRRERVSSTAKSLSLEGLKSRSMPVGQPGTLLFAMYASVGEVAFLDISATWNQALLGITPDPGKVDSRFLRYVLLDMRDDLLRDVRSNTQSNLNARQVGDIWFQRPPLPEQQAIANYLDRETARIDTLIEEQQRLIETLHERRNAVIIGATTEGLTSRTPLVKSGRGPLWDALPDGWLAGQIKNAATVTLGKMLQSNDTGSDVRAPYMRAANVQPDGVLALDDVNEMWFSTAELEKLSIQTGDVIVVEGGQGGFGRAAHVDKDLPGWGFQNSINRLRPTENFDGRYIAFYLIALRASGFIRAYSNVVSMPHLTAEKLARIPMPLPPLEDQRAIADHLDEQTAKIDTLIAEAEQFIHLSKERRSALITAAVTGQIDVREMM